MNRYFQLSFPVAFAEHREILAALLMNSDFEAVEELDWGIRAFIRKDDFEKSKLEAMLQSYPLFEDQDYEILEIEDRNWNEIWESSIQPLIISDICGIRAPFHEPLGTSIELVIMPKMAFGTGHHATTEMMIELMLKQQWKQERVLDAGSGSGILAILAEKLGAAKVLANEIEEPAIINCRENIQINGCHNVEVIPGNLNDIQHDNFDSVLMNINKNCILENAERIASQIKLSGRLFLSGILITDTDQIRMVFESLGFQLIKQLTKDQWSALLFRKN